VAPSNFSADRTALPAIGRSAFDTVIK